MGKVYLTGAGCGGLDWLTVQAKQTIEAADCILYDSLIDPSILDLNPSAIKIHTGKRAGQHAMPQHAIEKLLVECAEQYQTVVRLKGGDPFVFGRGYEEMMALKKARISCQVIPGLSSCIAIPEKCGIPVTCRKLSRGFMVFTAHGDDDAYLNGMLYSAAKFDGTIIILMGFSRRKMICEKLMQYGMDPMTDAAVLSSPDIVNTNICRSSLQNLYSDSAHMQAPAILVIGACAGLGQKKPVLCLTGSASFNKKMEQLLSPVFECNTVQELSLQPLAMDFHPEDLQGHGWLVFTSGHGIQFFFDWMMEKKADQRILANWKFAVIGKESTKVLASFGYYPDCMPETASGKNLAQKLLKQLDQNTVVHLFRNRQADDEMEEILKNRCQCFRHELYDASVKAKKLPETAAGIVFGSAYAARVYYKAHPESSIPAFSIGKKTTAEIEKYGQKVWTSDRPDAQALSEKILEVLMQSSQENI